MANIRIVGLLLLVSGCCSLLFQTTWFREFRLLFGASTLASSAVLAVFMGGLGIGNAVLGRIADRSTKPLQLYAKLEMLISVLCALSPFLIDLIRKLYIISGGQETLGSLGATIVRLTGATLVIGLPAFLMGGTLPAAARAATLSHDVGRRAVGLLYGLNTIGAVLGALIGTFCLFEAFGTRTTLWLTCIVNFLNSGVAWSMGRLPLKLSENVEKKEPPRKQTQYWDMSLYVCAGTIGAAFFLMEMVWYRMLGPILGGSTFTFGLILAVALAGIGIGGVVYPLIFRDNAPTMRSFVLTLAGEALAIALPYAMGDFLAVLAMNLRSFAIYGFWGQAAGWLVIASIVVLPASIVSGIQFPILIGLIGRGNTDVGKQLGKVFAWNTSGAIIGSLAGGFGLMSLLSATGVWKFVVFALMVIALSMYFLHRQLVSTRTLLPTIGLIFLTCLCMFAPGPTAVWRHSGIGAGRNLAVGSTRNEFYAWCNTYRRQIIFEADGSESTVAIAKRDSIAFIVNGKSDGDAITDAGTQIMLGALGALLHPAPKESLVIGLGTGESAGWLAHLPSVMHVDVVELEPAVLEMANQCKPINFDVLRDPKVSVTINDAREVLQTTKKKYDLIASEPSNPYRTGVSSLYTFEFYLAVASRLESNGIFSQWLQAYEVDARTVQTVLKTLRRVFGYVEIWETQAGDMVLICSATPLSYTVEELQQKLEIPEYLDATRAAWNTEQLEGILGHFVANDQFVQAVANHEGTAINSDDNNQIEYGFARTVGQRNEFSINRTREQAVKIGANLPPQICERVNQARINEIRLANMALSGTFDETTPLGRSLAWRAIGMNKLEIAVGLWNELSGLEDSGATLDLSEQILLGIAFAKTGDKRLPQLLERLTLKSRGNALAISVIFASLQANPTVTSAQLEKLFAEAQSNPFVNRSLLLETLLIAERVSTLGPAFAEVAFRSLSKPFALHAMDEQRVTSQLICAQQLGAKQVGWVLESLEPNPVWSQIPLELRVNAYQQTNSKYLNTATRELQLFMNDSQPSMLTTN